MSAAGSEEEGPRPVPLGSKEKMANRKTGKDGRVESKKQGQTMSGKKKHKGNKNTKNPHANGKVGYE